MNKTISIFYKLRWHRVLQEMQFSIFHFISFPSFLDAEVMNN